MINQNLENKQNSKNKNLRDYDKEPIVIKDNIMLNPIRKLCFLIWQLLNRTPRYFWNLIRYYKDYKNIAIYFYNDKIQVKYKNSILKEIKLNEITSVLKIINYSFPIEYYTSDIVSKKISIFVCIYALFGVAFVRGFLTFFILVVFLLLLFFWVQNLLYSNSKVEFFYDVLFIKGKKYDFINFMINSESEYKELKQYFQIKTGKNLDKVEKKITALFEFKKQDFE